MSVLPVFDTCTGKTLQQQLENLLAGQQRQAEAHQAALQAEAHQAALQAEVAACQAAQATADDRAAL